ncbi:MAG: aminoglycoside phosphotransferase family protein [Actinomycetota bacterium]|nr:aminoglycoside phosphotransferase family protein [Actinomycetota bacterium]
MLDTERAVRSLLSEVVPWASTGCEVRECNVVQVRKHLGKRMAFVGLEVTDASGGRQRGRVVIKRDGRRRADAVFQILRQLRDAGLRPPAHVRVPEPLGTSRDGQVLVQEWVPGEMWADSLGNREVHEASARAAEWLATLQSLPVPAPASQAHLSSVRRYARELAVAHPSQAAAIRQLSGRLLQGLGSVSPPLVPSHGDLHPKNLLIDGEVVTAVDLDTFAAREPAFDVGYAIGELIIMAIFRLGEAAAGLKAAAAFWFGYLQSGGTASPERVGLHVGRTFLQSLHYELCVLRNSKDELLHRWPELAWEWMESDGLATLEGALRDR